MQTEKHLPELMQSMANKVSQSKIHTKIKMSRKQRNWHIAGIVYFPAQDPMQV